ncbi:hypothetical protein SAMN05421510_101532 [Nitrosomonas ureae]|uniref:Uncharacterized protein n=1 Tax=Nitrosomonas ureae TaxID=44577 RepID=A0A1H9CJJ7_9PROT|nr:hypothetical protein C8R28_1001100 [Nitrosomonas ureae]PXX18337.1 hypothetical protein C8R27_10157 [Nitrosomonas ureae]SDU15228.1 hypothetical protein SAMN05216406_12838 [Nitrosomonas ureae]SEQ01396.1 hypothetical protein SAMN05421510_101532 [Nitrosomonas ureae]
MCRITMEMETTQNEILFSAKRNKTVAIVPEK